MPVPGAPHARRGFTVVELLVVILVIAVLMGLLIPAIMLAKAKATKTKTISLLAQVEAACNTYRTQNGIYPEVIPGTNPAQPMSTDAGDNAGYLLTALQSVDRESFHDQSGELKDSYKNKLRYRPARCYEFTAGVTSPKRIDGENPPRAESYQLWSAGPNGRDEVATWSSGKATGHDTYGDDIVTWK